MENKNWPFFGVWTPREDENMEAPFLCLEPWYGIADKNNFKDEFKNKLGINKLKINEIFNVNYTITIK